MKASLTFSTCIRSACMVLTLLLLGGCQDQTPVKFGFLGGLSGRTSDLGVAGRNGALLAVEQLNSAGGLNGRQIILETADDKQNDATAREAASTLIEHGAVAIVGPMTSQMSKAILPIINAANVVAISPTTSTSQLSAQDDYFFRIYPASKLTADELASYAIKRLGLKSLQVVYDLRNAAHTTSWNDQFEQSVLSLGGTINPPRTFKSGSDFSFFQLAEQLVKIKSDGLFIIANALDTAMLCQQLHKLGFTKPILASEWSGTRDLLQYGGGAVEGVTFYHTVNEQDQRSLFLEFKQAFSKRFGVLPGFASIHSYDTTRTLFAALKQNPEPSQLKETLLGLGPLPVLQGTITFDKYGDIQRQQFLIQVKDNRFQTLP